MTITTTMGAVSYAGNGVTTLFDFAFPIPAGALSVYLTENDVAILVDPSLYAATGLGATNGGTVTFVTAPASGKTVTIKRETPLTQDVALVTGAAFYAEVAEGALDRLTMQVQDMVEGLGRAVTVPVGSGIDPADLIESVEQSAVNAQASADQAAGSAMAASSSATAAAQDAALVAAALASLPRDEVVSISANRPVGADENGTLFAVNSTANAVVVTAPESDDAATGNVDSPFTFWVQRAGTNAVTVIPTAPDTIEGEAAPYSLEDGVGAKFVLDETATPHNWKAVPFGASVGDATPVGAAMWFTGTTPPAGWMVENGALLSRVTYPDLWAHAQASGMIVTEADWQATMMYRSMFSSGTDSTNFRLPDLITGGLFIRAQAGAASNFGRRQEDQFQSHVHTVGEHNNSGTANTNPAVLQVAASGSATLGTGNTGAAGGGSETCPKNAGRLPIIKAFNAVTNQAMVEVGDLANDVAALQSEVAVRQIVYAEVLSSGTTTSAIPLDDTVPQITEGAEVLTCTITPKSASSSLLIEANWNLTENTNGDNAGAIAALFRDSGANAIAAQQCEMVGQGNGGFASTGMARGILRCKVASGSTAATTIRLRLGPAGSNAGSVVWRWNGWNNSRVLGGVWPISITITEVA